MTLEEKYAILVFDQPGLNTTDIAQLFTEYLKEKVDACTRYDVVRGSEGTGEMEWFPNGDYIEYAALVV